MVAKAPKMEDTLFLKPNFRSDFPSLDRIFSLDRSESPALSGEWELSFICWGEESQRIDGCVFKTTTELGKVQKWKEVSQCEWNVKLPEQVWIMTAWPSNFQKMRYLREALYGNAVNHNAMKAQGKETWEKWDRAQYKVHFTYSFSQPIRQHKFIEPLINAICKRWCFSHF